MNQYITGSTIRRLREGQGLKQAELAERLGVSDKAVSKWETGRGYPDIALLTPLAEALGVSVIELLSGSDVRNHNCAGNMLRSQFYVCPVCGNIIHSSGEAVISCCGLTLPPLELEEADDAHRICCEKLDDELFVSVRHDMTKEHYISFLAYLTGDSCSLVKLYPEGAAEARFRICGRGRLYAYCNRHGLFGCTVGRNGQVQEISVK